MDDHVILEMRDICKSFPGVQALDHVSLSLAKGEIHALVGENGAGKSTLMRILAGAESKDTGEIVFEDHPLHIHTPADAIKHSIIVIYQELSLAPHLDAAKNIFMGRYPTKTWNFVDRNLIYEKTTEIIHDLDFHFDPRIPVRKLSIAQQQVVEIARAKIVRVKVLVLDEPSAVLGRHDVENLFKLINRLRHEGVAIIYISHRLEEVFEIADRVTVLKDGKYIATRSTNELNMQSLIKLMIGRDAKEFRKDITNNYINAPIALSVRNLTRKDVFENISFDLHVGEIVGFAGLVGSGRTEIAKSIFGADPRDEGEVKIFGKPLEIRSPYDAVRAGIGFIPENRKEEGLLLNRTVADNIILSFMRAFTRTGLIQNKRVKAVVDKLSDRLMIKMMSMRQLVKFLSGGNQQKVVFAKWVNSDCKVLIVDEPTRGVDVGAKIEMYNLLNKLRAQGTAILMISSDISEILGMCDRILVIQHGQIVSMFSHMEIEQDPSIVERIVEVRSGE